MTYDIDIALGQRVLRMLVDDSCKPPQVRQQFQSSGRLHAELSHLGFRLLPDRPCNKPPKLPEGGAHLFYLKDRVLVRIKTRGGNPVDETPYWKYRSGSPHLTVSILNQVKPGTPPNTSWENEYGKISIHGGIVNKSPLNLPGWRGKALDEGWADDTHFGFPASDLDDEVIDRLEPAHR